MATLELECPSCGATLNLDAGFSGGVCRCSSCGTLMTVPTSEGERAEALRRPERPEIPGQPRPAQSSPSSYVTTSGRRIAFDDSRVVTARRRRVVRSVTVLIFAGLLGLVAVVAVAAVVTMLAQGPTADTEGGSPAGLWHTAQGNPFVMPQANVLGLEVEQDTAVVVDAGLAARGWLSAVKAALRAGLVREGPHRVQIVYATSEGPRVLSPRPRRLDSITADEVDVLHDAVEARSGAAVAEAVAVAMDQSPHTLVLVTGSALHGPERLAVLDLAGKAEQFVLIHLNERDEALGEVVQQAGGRYLLLNDAQLADWLAQRP